MDVVPKDALLVACLHYYKESEITRARDRYAMKFDSRDRFRQRKPENILSAIYDSMQSIKTHEAPAFLALDLNRIPCIELKNVDGVSLVCRQESLARSVDQMLEEHGNMKRMLEEIQNKINSFSGSVTGRSNVVYRGSSEMLPANPSTSIGETSGASSAVAVGGAGDLNGTEFTYAQVAHSSRPTNQNLEVPRTDEDGFTRVGPQRRRQNSNQVVQRQRRPKPPPITGRKTGTVLRAVAHVKKVYIFVSRLDPDVTVEDLKNYVEGVVNGRCDVEKLTARFNTYSSFRIVCDAVHREKNSFTG